MAKSSTTLPLAIHSSPSIVTSKDVCDALMRHHGRGDWLAFQELRAGTGYGRDAEQRIDVWAMHTWPSKALTRIAYEVKVSRSDFLREIKQPRKRSFALMVSNQFYFATPPGLLNSSEIPAECGLIEVQPDDKLHIVVTAPWRDSIMPTWRFVASLLRHQQVENARRHHGA